MMHPAVRETLARRLSDLQREVVTAERQAQYQRTLAQEAYDTWQSLRDEKLAIQQSLAAEDDTQPIGMQETIEPGSASASRLGGPERGPGETPAERAQTYPEGETPPPAERAPTS